MVLNLSKPYPRTTSPYYFTTIMKLLTRSLCLSLMLSLLLPTSVDYALAQENASEEAPVEQTALIPSETANSSSSVSTETLTNITSSSESDSATSTSNETDTMAHDVVLPREGLLISTSSTETLATATSESTLPTTEVITSGGETVGTTTAAAPVGTIASTTVIETGEATAGANIVNVANSTFVNSTGEIVVANYFQPMATIDLRTATSSFTTGVLCVMLSCSASEGVSVYLTGTSTIDNAIALSATTGSNTISSSSDARITTGNALVGINLVNLANVNMVDATYFIAALNIFHGLSGDLVFPSLKGFFDSMFSGTVPSSVELGSGASVTNDVSFDTGTGGNQTYATASSITTGKTQTMGTILNQLNSNAIGGANLAIILRTDSYWNGELFSAPEGMVMTRGEDGSIYLTKTASRPLALDEPTHVRATSSASIVNHLDLGAFTGNNGIFDADSARIETGTARAAATVMNIANQNIIGRNWFTAVINIFGGFTGNIAFGRPDLWVGEQVEAPTPLSTGSAVTFTFTITNKGDAPATSLSFTPTFDSHISLTSPGPDTEVMGTLAPGESATVTYQARVDAPPGTDMLTSGNATAHETDNNTGDNTDSVTLRMPFLGSASSQNFASYTVSFPTKRVPSAVPLTVTRTTVRAQVGNSSRTVHEELTIENPSTSTSGSIDLHDLLKDPLGIVLKDEAWALGTLAPHEVVTVGYDVVFDEAAPTGTYLLSTILASDVVGDAEFKDNGSIELSASTVLTPRAPSVVGAVRGVSVSEPVVIRAAPQNNQLVAAVANAQIPAKYALGFVAAAAVLVGLVWAVLRLRRRLLS